MCDGLEARFCEKIYNEIAGKYLVPLQRAGDLRAPNFYSPDMAGTGFVVKVSGRKILITAWHNISLGQGRGCDLPSVDDVYTIDGRGKTVLIEGDWYMLKGHKGSKEVDVDVAFLIIDESGTSFKRFFCFEESFISHCRVDEQVLCAFFGFPQSKNKIEQNPKKSFDRRMFIGQSLAKSEIDSMTNVEHDLMIYVRYSINRSFVFGPEGMSQAPDPRGMSGGPVLSVDSDGAFSVVGVGTRFYEGEKIMGAYAISEIIREIELFLD